MRKRIGFVISTQSLINAGGIGQFSKAFFEMAKHYDWIVDLILDREPNNWDFISSLDDTNGKIYIPDNPLHYKDHQSIFAFTDSVNFEKETNFRNSFFKAITENLYDLIICNVPESYIPVYATTMAKWTKVLFYAHNENFIGLNDFENIGPYSHEYNRVYESMLNLPEVYVATQTLANRDGMLAANIATKCKSIEVLPMPFPDKDMFEPYYGLKSGILWVGRWEERKDPKAFLDLIAQIKLPVKVITNKTGAPKFEKELKELDVEFDIKVDLDSKEKSEFIKSAKLMYMPSKKESYGYTLYEALNHMPVFVEDYAWTRRCGNLPNLIRVGKEHNLAALVKEFYDRPSKPSKILYSLQDNAYNFWKYFVDRPHEIHGRKTASGNITKQDNLYYHAHILGLNRKPSIEDIEPVYRAGYLFTREQNQFGTWLTKSRMPAPNLESEEESIF